MSDTRPTSPPPPGVSLGKGRPTPKRAEKERRTGPVAPPPQTRKEAAKRMREQASADRGARKAGIAANDERALLTRDRGPVRSTVRDVVDSRRNVGVLLLPVALLLVAAQLTHDATVLRVATSVWTAGVLAMLLDTALLALRVRRTLAALHPGEAGLARHIGYGVLRSTVFRRFRMPPPKVAPGSRVVPG